MRADGQRAAAGRFDSGPARILREEGKMVIVAFGAGVVVGLIVAALVSGAYDIFMDWRDRRSERKRRKGGGG